MEKQTNDEQNTIFAESPKETQEKKKDLKKEEPKKPAEPFKSEYSNYNIYQKMQLAKTMIQKNVNSKSGKNDYAKFSYLELPDFLPTANDVLNTLGLFSKFNIYTKIDDNGITNEKATLTIVDMDDIKSTAIVYETATADATVKGASAIQNLGSKHTYLRRYLYVEAFDLAVSDDLDKRSGDKDGDEKGNGVIIPDNHKGRMINEMQKEKLTGLCLELPERAEKMLKFYKVNGIDEMTEIDASKAIKQMIVAKNEEDNKNEPKTGELLNG